MVTALAYLPSSRTPAWLDAIQDRLRDSDKESLARLTEQSTSLLAPLARATSRQDLDVILKHAAPRYSSLLAELADSTWRPIDGKVDHEKLLFELYRRIRSASQPKADLFGIEAFDHYSGALESAQAFAASTLRTDHEVREGVESEAYRRTEQLKQSVSVPALYANMAISALLLIVLDTIDEWLVEAIPILAAAADDFMTEVEDEFFAREQPDDVEEPSIAIDSVREELGL